MKRERKEKRRNWKLGEEETVGRTPKSSQFASVLRGIMSKGEGNATYTTFFMPKELFYTSHRPSCFICVASAGSASAPPNMPRPLAHVSYCIFFLESILKSFQNQNSMGILWVDRKEGGCSSLWAGETMED